MTNSPAIVISIISHRQAELIARLLDDIQRCCSHHRLAVVLTLNVDEELPFTESDFTFPLTVIRNNKPRGFGENHNAAFNVARRDFFCVLNPDIRLTSDPFARLIETLQGKDVGVSAPLVTDNEGNVEDSARRLPTPTRILAKALGFGKSFDYEIGEESIRPDWVAGMFILFPSAIFEAMGGFDDRYFLYYEDVDLCCRLRLAGYSVILNPRASVIHDARRESHRNPEHRRWHLASMLRFFTSRSFIFCLLKGKPSRQA